MTASPLNSAFYLTRAFGNTDPDTDPTSTYQSHEPPIVVVD